APIQEIGFWFSRAYAQIQAGQPFGEARMRLQELGVLGPQATVMLENLEAHGGSAAEKWRVLTTEFGRFNGAMKEQESTWAGLTSTLKDVLNLGLSSAFRPLFTAVEGGLKGIIDRLSSPGTEAAIERFAHGLEEGLVRIKHAFDDLRGGDVSGLADLLRDA